ncbi:MAG TPA: AAA family ATPase, partial [Polyangiaceae bacterium]|nr:AAA family ATPase [Polyangiaceae bacterium]
MSSDASAPSASAEVLARGAPFGRFLLVETCGRGARFDVHRAKAFGVLGFEKDLAIKIVRPEVAADADARARLVEAAKRSIDLCHANVLAVTDLGVAPLGDEERTYVVTELARGPSLDKLLERERASSSDVREGAALALGAEVAKALDHAHRRRGGAVVHGALTARQVFVTSDGEVKVGDFAVGAGPEADAAGDLVALGKLLEDMAAVVSGPKDALLDAAALLASGRVADAASAHELLLEHAYVASPDAHQRDPAKWVGAQGGAPPPSLALGDWLAEPELCVPGREVPLVVLGAIGTEETRLAVLDDARRAGGVVLCETPTIVLAFGLVDPDGRDAELAFSFALGRVAAARGGEPTPVSLVTTGVLERAADGAARLVLASRSDLFEIAESRSRTPTGSRVAASSRASLAARGAFSFEVDAEQPELSWLIGSSGALSSQSRFVGRTTELRALAEAVFAAAHGGKRLLVVSGAAGSGKTRLVLELERRASGRLSVALARTPRRGEPLDGLAAAVLELAGAKHADEIDARLRPLGLAESDRYVLSAIAGASHAGEPAIAAVRSSFAELVRKVAHGRPLVVGFDDAHRLDAATRAIVRDAAEDPDSRVLYVLIERREPGSAEGDPDGPRLVVPPLDDDAVAALLSTRLGARLIPPDAVELFVAKTGGLPQAVLELVRELVEKALAQVKNGVLVIDKRAADVTVRSAQDAMGLRIAGLGVEHRRLVAALHVLGARAGVDALAAVSGQDTAVASASIASLEAAGLVVD